MAEAYSVGQVMAEAVTATGGTDNAKIIAYLHSGVTLNTVQGPVKFDALGENGAAAAFVFQWQKNNFNQVCRPAAPGQADHRHQAALDQLTLFDQARTAGTSRYAAWKSQRTTVTLDH